MQSKLEAGIEMQEIHNQVNTEHKYIQIQDLLAHPDQLTRPDTTCYHAVKNNWDHAAKPLDSLGIFETMTAQIGSILGTDHFDLKKKAILTFCADMAWLLRESVSPDRMSHWP